MKALLHITAIAGVLLITSVDAPAAFLQRGTVTGTATYRERMALPANAVFEAVLEDVSKADAPASRLRVASSRRRDTAADSSSVLAGASPSQNGMPGGWPRASATRGGL